MNTFRDHRSSPRRTWLTRGVGAMSALFLTVGAIAPAAVAAPDPVPVTAASLHQNVAWMNAETATYLTSIGMDVMVPSWIPAPFEGVAPDVYAGGGSYSLYWMMPGDSPTFLHVTGVVGGAFPAGSKADLNIPLEVNASVQGWPAIQDIGIPAGSDTPIYDQVWWIANGVLYSVESRNLGSDSLTLANSMVYLEAPVAVVPTEEPYVPPTEEPYVPPTEEPYVPPTEEPYVPPTEAPVSEPVVVEQPVENAAPVVTEAEVEAPAAQQVVVDTSGAPVAEEPESVAIPDDSAGEDERESSDASAGDGTAGPRVPVMGGGDGTAGPRPPVIGGDGTGGLFDTALPRITFRP